jgi:predicted protein tyrosine phosphatase
MTETTLSQRIQQARYGAIANPYQGSDRRVLFVCSMGILRSATGARIYGHKYNTRSAGTHGEALIRVTQQLLDWADQVVFVNKENYLDAAKNYNLDERKVLVIDIPDRYEHMHPEIIKAFNEQYEKV